MPEGAITASPGVQLDAQFHGHTLCLLREDGQHTALTVSKDATEVRSLDSRYVITLSARLHQETGTYVLGHAWLNPETGEFCAEEGSTIGTSFTPDLIKGPDKGTIR